CRLGAALAAARTWRRSPLRVLVLGGYGAIGREVSRRLIAAGHRVVVLGRNAAAARRLLPDAEFLEIDLRDQQSSDAWQRHLQGVEAVVNAAGALQTGGRDDVEAVHHRAIAALVRACEAGG